MILGTYTLAVWYFPVFAHDGLPGGWLQSRIFHEGGLVTLPNARMKVALRFMSQDITYSHLKLSVNISHFGRNFSVLIQNIPVFARKR